MKCILPLIYLLFCCHLSGQKNDNVQIKNAESLYEKANYFIYTHKDSAYFYFRQSYEIFKKQKDWLSCVLILKRNGFTNSYHYDLMKLKQTIISIDSILKEKKTFFDTIPNIHKLRNSHLISKTNYYIKINNYKEAKTHAVRLRKRMENIPDSSRTTYDTKLLIAALEFEAGIYKRQGKYQKAEQLYLKCLRLSSDKLNKNFSFLTYRLLGDMYGQQGKFMKGNLYLKKGLKNEINSGSNVKNRIAKTCYAIADNFIKMNLPDSARYYLSVANKQLTEEDILLKSQFYEISGTLTSSIGDYEGSILNVDKALKLILSNEPELNRTGMARLLALKSKVMCATKEYQGALGTYDKALEWLYDYPKPAVLSDTFNINKIYDKYQYLKILKEQINTLIDVKDYERGWERSKKAMTIIDKLKPSFRDEKDKQFLIENFYPIFESGIGAVYELYKSTGNKSYIDKAFYIMEKSKSVILLEALLNAKAYQFSKIPDHLLEKQNQLEASLNELGEKLQRKKKDSLLQERIFRNNVAYNELIDCLEIEYPDYYKLKYDNKVTTLKEFQNSLTEKTLVISYFSEKETLYALAITRNSKEIIKIPIPDTFNQQILSFKKSLSNYLSDTALLRQQSNQLYELLLEPLLRNKSFNKMVIIPDGTLNYIPFEVLHDGHEYLIKYTAVSEVHSATMLQHLRQKRYTDKNMVAFAPSFSGRYTALVSSKRETQNILSYFKGEVLEDTEATLNAFDHTNSSSYGIIHLATHAIIDDEIPESSHLVFAAKNGIDSLRVSDIYSRKINASLVVLSACETAIGRLKKGEGMISLSRAFFYAGALSLASSKWQINDASSSEIITDFYKHLARGEKKDEALRLAKIHFLEKYKDNEYYLHPYWWSGITISGNMAPINTNSHSWRWLVSLIFIFPVFWWIRKRRKAN